jgi:oxygen-independent coproporphyrinogen-3 oxidase
VKNLVQKYNIPGPRYTSYPTVPYWDEGIFSKKAWLESVSRAFDESNEEEGISLYIHLPFCESLCTFCGCHKRITKRHSVETPYVETVLKEWDLYLDILEGTPRIKEIHLGGGTPTFFSPESLDRLITGILSKAEKTENFEFSFEGHPNNTTREHLQKLYDLGFRRNSFGVQDYNEKVQKAINRIQPFENVKESTEMSREIGYTSVSHDLIFGLPHQTLEAITDSIEKTAQLMPDRIAFYSYAHVPWIKGVGSRGYNDEDLPKDEVKRALYEYGKERFLELGYEEIGMDHFALKSDSLYKAVEEKTLHRNFMGYSSGKTGLMIGLGMSSISDSWYSFSQNVKTVEEYEKLVHEGEIPVFRGHVLSEEDLVIRKHILNIMCHFRTDWSDPAMQFPELKEGLEKLSEMVDDGLIEIHEDHLIVNEEGRPFIRNICMAFDLHLIRKAPQTRVFSMTI